MKIYTKKGDEGYSDILKKRVRKDDEIFNLVGTIDKLSSSLNFARIEVEKTEIKEEILKLQKDLVSLNGFISGYSAFLCDVSFFEERIDYYTSEAGSFEGFSFAGTKAGAYIDFARCICREAERCAVGIDYIDIGVIKYLNRMSDYLYMLSKYVDM